MPRSVKKKLRSFSSYKTKKDLSEVLHKYRINSNNIKKIPPFKLKSVKIDDNDKELKKRIIEIKPRIGIIGLATLQQAVIRMYVTNIFFNIICIHLYCQ